MKLLRRRPPDARKPIHLPTNRLREDEGPRPTCQPTARSANAVPSTSFELLFKNDFARKCINIYFPLTKNMNSMVPIYYSSVQPGFQTGRLTGRQGLQKNLS